MIVDSSPSIAFILAALGRLRARSGATRVGSRRWSPEAYCLPCWPCCCAAGLERVELARTNSIYFGDCGFWLWRDTGSKWRSVNSSDQQPAAFVVADEAYELRDSAFIP
jgi:hypothetical protein